MIISKLSVDTVDGFVKFSTVNSTVVVTLVVLLNPFKIVMVLVAVFTVDQSSVVPDGIPDTPVQTNDELGVTLLGYVRNMVES